MFTIEDKRTACFLGEIIFDISLEPKKDIMELETQHEYLLKKNCAVEDFPFGKE
jgi:hypothetical protein